MILVRMTLCDYLYSVSVGDNMPQDPAHGLTRHRIQDMAWHRNRSGRMA